jgi:hypothetical protein
MRWISMVCVVLPLLSAAGAQAKPTAPALFCDTYADASACAGRGTTCQTCHTSTSPAAPDWNAYGLQIVDAVLGNALDMEAPGVLDGVLRDIENDDPDEDGVSSLEEILLGTLPGDAFSHFAPPALPQGTANPTYKINTWDPAFAGRRMVVAFCGRSPTYDELQLVANAATPDAARALIHAGLDACLASPFWLGEGLSRLADERVRPIDLGVSFDWDYRMWRYVMTDDRDVRELLTADYHVREASPFVLSEVENVVDDGTGCANDFQCAFDHSCQSGVCRYRAGAQPLIAGERAGMIGTQWFHFINTMFSAMPRTTAAQAMRGYLGIDIAKQQGLDPTINEPLDVDEKGVAQAECAQCHSTLDPATYVFAKYQGIEGGGASLLNAQRPISLGLWASADEEPQGVLLGQPVNNLREWGAVAANSDEFMHNMSRILFEHAIGRPPGPQDKEELDALWPSWSSAEVAYSTNRFLHALIDTNAFGAP